MKISSESTDGSRVVLVSDLAGTIIRPEPSVARQYCRAAREIGYDSNPPSVDLVDRRFSKAFSLVDRPGEKLCYGTTLAEGRWFWKRVLSNIFPRLDNQGLTELTDRLYRRFQQASAWAFFSGAREVLRVLDEQGVILGLLSNWDARGPQLVENLQLDSLFDSIIFSSQVGYEKPDKRIFRLVREELSVSGTQTRFIMLGNRVPLDLEVPDLLGWETVLFSPGSEDRWKRKVDSWSTLRDSILDG